MGTNNAYWKGKHLSAETKKKISEARKGRFGGGGGSVKLLLFEIKPTKRKLSEWLKVFGFEILLLCALLMYWIPFSYSQTGSLLPDLYYTITFVSVLAWIGATYISIIDGVCELEATKRKAKRKVKA